MLVETNDMQEQGLASFLVKHVPISFGALVVAEDLEINHKIT